MLCKHITSIINYLQEEKKHNPCDDIPSTFGTKVFPFGQGRIKLISILNLAFSIEENSKLAAILSEDNIPELLMVYKRIIYLFWCLEFHGFSRMEQYVTPRNILSHLDYFRFKKYRL